MRHRRKLFLAAAASGVALLASLSSAPEARIRNASRRPVVLPDEAPARAVAALEKADRVGRIAHRAAADSSGTAAGPDLSIRDARETGPFRPHGSHRG